MAVTGGDGGLKTPSSCSLCGAVPSALLHARKAQALSAPHTHYPVFSLEQAHCFICLGLHPCLDPIGPW